MRKIFMTLLAAAWLLPAAAVSDDDAEVDPKLQAGAKLARQCSVCHGKTGISRDPEVPHLAGQPEFYLEKSLTDFVKGIREDRRMSLVVKNLSREDVKALAAWYASLPRGGE